MYKKKNGFTLIEMIVVLAIIAIMATTLFPSLLAYRQRGIEQDRANQEYVVNKAMKQYYALTGQYLDLTENAHYNLPTFLLTPDGEDLLEQELLAKTGVKPDTAKYNFIYNIFDPSNPTFTVQ